MSTSKSTDRPPASDSPQQDSPQQDSLGQDSPVRKPPANTDSPETGPPNPPERLFFRPTMTAGQKLAAGLSLLGAVLVLGASWFGGFNSRIATGSSDQGEGSSGILKVLVSPARRQEAYRVFRSFVGEVEARRQSALGFENSGLVIEITKDEGDAVQAGEMLGRLDDRRLQARRAELAARLEQARQQLREMVAGPREEVKRAAQAEVARLKAELRLAELRTAREARLHRRNATTDAEYDDVRLTRDATKASLAAAQARLDELKNGTRAERIAAQQALVAQIEAELATIDIDLDKLRLMAPFAGTIAARHLDEGRVVAAGEAVLELLETHHLQARIGVAAPEACQLAVGQTYRLQFRQGQRQARVVAVRPDRDSQTRTVSVLLQLVDSAAGAAGPPVRVGDLATLQLEQLTKQQGYWLPARALIEGRRGLWDCFVAEPLDGPSGSSKLYRVSRREVEVLHPRENHVFVRGTLRPGEPVIVDGTHRIVPGQQVHIQHTSDSSLSTEHADPVAAVKGRAPSQASQLATPLPISSQTRPFENPGGDQ